MTDHKMCGPMVNSSSLSFGIEEMRDAVKALRQRTETAEAHIAELDCQLTDQHDMLEDQQERIKDLTQVLKGILGHCGDKYCAVANGDYSGNYVPCQICGTILNVLNKESKK